MEYPTPYQQYRRLTIEIATNTMSAMNSGEGAKKVTEVTRRDIVDALLLANRPFHGRLDLIAFLRRIWRLGEMPSTDYRFENAEGDIWQHMVNNSDWSNAELLYHHLGILDVPDETFAQFLETCVHPLVLPDLVE